MSGKGVGDEEGEMELSLWGGGWGLPSIDPESIQSLAAVRFAGAPVTVKECNNPWKSPNGLIPFFNYKTGYSYSAHEIGVYLRSKNYSGDYVLNSKQCAETVAYSQLIWEGLHVAYQYFFWLHELNYSSITRPFYGRRLPWIYKLWYPERLKGSAKEIITSIYKDAENNPPSHVEPFVLDKASKCVLLLSQKLGDENEFFMGTKAPTTMDAVVFSYLSVFWRVKLPHNPMREVIASYPNLEKYLSHMLQRYFPPGSNKVPQAGEMYGDDGEVISKEVMEGSLTTSQKVGMGLVVSAIMFLYALKNGIIRIPVGSVEVGVRPRGGSRNGGGAEGGGGGEDGGDEDDEYWE